jgi:hypothetical protein
MLAHLDTRRVNSRVAARAEARGKNYLDEKNQLAVLAAAVCRSRSRALVRGDDQIRAYVGEMARGLQAQERAWG